MKGTLSVLSLCIVSATLAQSDLDNKYTYDRGEFRLKLSLPLINQMNFKLYGEDRVSNLGILGESIGLEYAYRDNKFIEVNYTLAIARQPQPVNGYFQICSSSYFSITNNTAISRFTLGYGLNYGWNTFKETYIDENNSGPGFAWHTDKTQTGLGLTLNTYYRVWKNFHLGLIYKPTFLVTNPETRWDYEHVISLDFLFRIMLNNKSSTDI